MVYFDGVRLEVHGIVILTEQKEGESTHLIAKDGALMVNKMGEGGRESSCLGLNVTN